MSIALVSFTCGGTDPSSGSDASAAPAAAPVVPSVASPDRGDAAPSNAEPGGSSVLMHPPIAAHGLRKQAAVCLVHVDDDELGDIVGLANAHGTLMALSGSDGHTIWTISDEAIGTSVWCGAEEHVFTQDRDGAVVIWHPRTSGQWKSAPLVAELVDVWRGRECIEVFAANGGKGTLSLEGEELDACDARRDWPIHGALVPIERRSRGVLIGKRGYAIHRSESAFDSSHRLVVTSTKARKRRSFLDRMGMRDSRSSSLTPVWDVALPSTFDDDEALWVTAGRDAVTLARKDRSALQLAAFELDGGAPIYARKVELESMDPNEEPQVFADNGRHLLVVVAGSTFALDPNTGALRWSVP
jgi:outer membrane protein assembly factor BamB